LRKTASRLRRKNHMNIDIACIPGDGIGPEIVAEAKKVLEAVCRTYGHTISFTDLYMGGCAIDRFGVPLPEETVETAKKKAAVLMGSIGGDAKTSPWYRLEPSKRPEAGLLAIRKALGLYANLRPAYLFQELADSCPLAAKEGGRKFDLVIVRELTGGLYFGERWTKTIDGVETAVDTLKYNENEIRRVAKTAFEIAQKRRKKVTSVDKANVLDTSRLWRKVVHEVAEDFPDVEVSDMLVDNCAMQLVKNPEQFDVILTENMFGDILSDEASMITGSIGMLSSASLNETSFGLYEPSHGSAPDIAGQNIANPIATVLSAAMMLRYSFGLTKEAAAIEAAVRKTLADGFRSKDLMPRDPEEAKCLTEVSCSGMGDAIAARIA
jgi:3-isopropylmalate dehydrogenase